MAEMTRDSSSTRMAQMWCFFILFINIVTIGVHCQPNPEDFISIDCGIEEGSNYTDNTTGLKYTSDYQFVEAGTIHKISSEYTTPQPQWTTLRSFETGTRNCYNLRPVEKGQKYMVRAAFFYGNYDGKRSEGLQFDLHFGVNVWRTVNISDPLTIYGAEAMTVASADIIWVCLVNTGFGTPFISSIEVRPLKNTMYPFVNPSSTVALFLRASLGSSTNETIRYPADPYDRYWKPWSIAGSKSISTTAAIQNRDDDLFEVPSAVLRAAVEPANGTFLELFSWSTDGQAIRDQYHFAMHVAEFQSAAEKRTFNACINGEVWSGTSLTPSYLLGGSVYNPDPYSFYRYNFTLVGADPALPPICNAMEMFTVIRQVFNATDPNDVDAIMAIKAQYRLKRNWMGDPCAPTIYTWNGLNCSYSASDSPRIISLNLSSSGLTGEISASIANLKAITYLDLSNNYITGALPDFLAEFPSLQFLNLTGNQLNGSIPSALLTKSENGGLMLSTGGNPQLCVNEGSCETTTTTKKKSSDLIIVIVSVASVVFLLLVVFAGWRLCRRRQHASSTSVKPRELDDECRPFQHESRQFTYNELVVITSNFKQKIGEGGFGAVYFGTEKNGAQVAVKLRSQSSPQGIKEFLAEAQLLTRVHHKNLVSLVGYCKDGIYMALVYEYMAQGSLYDNLRGTSNQARVLSWGERLRIALEAAQGLEYLHKGCSPPIIHRDVKTSNILLGQNLEAKIADFGLSKAFQSDTDTHISTSHAAGTPGFLDPECPYTLQLSEKSDVYSFGVVLLVLITGKPAIVANTGAGQMTHIAQWVHTRLERGNIAGIVDARLRGDYDVNSVWKVADLAMSCAAEASAQRPSMSDAVIQLKEGLALEPRSLNLGTTSLEISPLHQWMMALLRDNNSYFFF